MKPRFSIIFMITENCNCNCFFCSRNNLSRTFKTPNLKDIHKAFTLLSSEYPSSKLILSGGEPTLSKDFIKIVEYATSLFEKVEIQTNGTFCIDTANQLEPLLRKNLYLQFSLDGTQYMHDKIRGNGVFLKAITNIRNYKDVYEHISISTTVFSAYNISDVLSLAEYLNQLKFRRLTVSIVQPLNPKQERLIDCKDWNEFVDDLLPKCHYRVDISKLFDFDLMDSFLRSGSKWAGITNCGRGRTHIYVDTNLDVLPCTCMSYSVGNLLHDDYGIIKQRLEESNQIIISENSVCYNCKYKSICNGGCPGYSTKIFGSPNMGDIRCPKVKKHASSMGII